MKKTDQHIHQMEGINNPEDLNRRNKAEELRAAGFSGTDDEVIEQYLVWVEEALDACTN